MPPLSDNYDILCHTDGSICTIDGAFLCPDFPEDVDLEDATHSEVLQHIQDTGLSVEKLLCFASEVQLWLGEPEWNADIVDAIAAAFRDILGVEIRDLILDDEDASDALP